MKFEIEKALLIPQSNVRDSSKLTMESLLVYKPKPVAPDYDLEFNPKTSTWNIKESFLTFDKPNAGFTAALHEGSVFLLKTDETQHVDLKPRFLKAPTGEVFKSDYLTFIVTKSGVDLEKTTGFYLETSDGDVKEITPYLLTTIAPVVKKAHSLEPQVLTAEKLAQLEAPIPQAEIPAVEHTQQELDAAKEYYEKMNEEILPTENVVFEETVAEDVPVTETPVVPAKQDYTGEPVDDIF